MCVGGLSSRSHLALQVTGSETGGVRIRWDPQTAQLQRLSSGCSMTTSFSILDSAEGWGQHQGSAMEALVPAPVGEGHQLLDPLPLTVPPLHLCLIAWALLFLLLGDEAQSGRYSAICPGSLSMSSRAPI